jgi:hypothetical protein
MNSALSASFISVSLTSSSVAAASSLERSIRIEAASITSCGCLAHEQQSLRGVKFGSRVSLLEFLTAGIHHLGVLALRSSIGGSLGSYISLRRWLYLGLLVVDRNSIGLPHLLQRSPSLFQRGVVGSGPDLQSSRDSVGYTTGANGCRIGTKLPGNVSRDLREREESLAVQSLGIVEEVLVSGWEDCSWKWCRGRGDRWRSRGDMSRSEDDVLGVDVAVVFGRVTSMSLAIADDLDCPTLALDTSSFPRLRQVGSDLTWSLTRSGGIHIDCVAETSVGSTPTYDARSGSPVDICGDVARGVPRGDVEDRITGELSVVGENGLILRRKDAGGLDIGD